MNTSKISLFLIASFTFFLQPIYSQQRFKLLAEQEFKGLLSDKSVENIQVLVIHGTGIKKSSYADKLMDYSFKKVKSGPVNSEIIYRSSDSKISVQKKTAQFEANRLLTFYVVHWSDYTNSNKKDLRKMHKLHGVNRGVLSKFLKNRILINQFYDFVVFSNNQFKKEINLALDLTFENMLMQSAGKISNVNLVSGSLGSSIFMEYVNKLHLGLKDTLHLEKATTEKMKVKLEFVQAKPDNFFMLTNQIHFLEPIIAQDTTYEILKNLKPLQMVAFRHTNDALSFYLPTNVAANFVPYRTVKAINIRYKNPICGNLFFAAHERPFKIEKIFDAILFGNQSRWVKIKK